MKYTKVIEVGRGYLVLDTDEGRVRVEGGTVSWRCNNPGNLKYGKFAQSYGAIGKDFGGHAVFPTKEMGQEAKYNLLFGPDSRYIRLSLLDAMKTYAPTSDGNDPLTYAKYLASKVGISINTSLKSLTKSQRDDLILWISVYEGYKVGTLTHLDKTTKKVGAVKAEAITISQIQNFLAEKKFYAGKIDGDAGRQTLAAIDEYLKSISIDSTKWLKARKLVGIEQAIYKEHQIDAGLIDGLVGPQVRYAREVWTARQHGDLSTVEQVERFRDLPPKNDWPLQRNVENYFGAVGQNQTKLILPFPMYLAWDKTQIIKSFSIHEKVHDSALRCFERIANEYDAEARKKLGIDLFGGCLNVRKMRGGSSWSMHSWGIAIDFDPDRNQLRWGRDQARLAKADAETFWKIWEEEGWLSLGRSRNYDWMHLQAARLD